MKRLKRVIILIVVMFYAAFCFLLVSPGTVYGFIEQLFNQPVLPVRKFDAATWPRRPYTEKQLPIRQAMSDSILRDFLPGMTRKEIEGKLGPPDRFESDKVLMTGNQRDQNFAKGDFAISYIVLQDFASGPFSLCFVFDGSSRLKKVSYRWG